MYEYIKGNYIYYGSLAREVKTVSDKDNKF